MARCRPVIRDLSAVGVGLIKLLPSRRYFLSLGPDLSSRGSGAIVVEGSSGLIRATESWIADAFRAPRLIIPLRPVKTGPSSIVRRLLVWRQGRPDKPVSLADMRQRINEWFQEDGIYSPLSSGIFAPCADATIEQVAVVGFHNGIQLQGGDRRVERCFVDCAGHGIECTNMAGTCQISEVVTHGLWSNAVVAQGKDALGDHGYRPGIAIYAHDSTDGLQINSYLAECWINGLVLSVRPETSRVV